MYTIPQLLYNPNFKRISQWTCFQSTRKVRDVVFGPPGIFPCSKVRRSSPVVRSVGVRTPPTLPPVAMPLVIPTHGTPAVISVTSPRQDRMWLPPPLRATAEKLTFYHTYVGQHLCSALGPCLSSMPDDTRRLFSFDLRSQ